MVIVRGDGSLILEEGDPNFVDILGVGPTVPQNVLLDEDPTTPVSSVILTQFGIPFVASEVLGSAMPGYDIRNQDAVTMLKLSLIAELLNLKFAEVEIDPFGIARFYVVGEEVATNLDIRYCIPTSEIKQPAELVIVRGYDPPPTRELRTSFDGLKNKELMAYEDCAEDSCESSFVARHATISYDDPLLDQTYLDDIKNSYELQAFESLLGYVIDLDLPDGIEDVTGLKITFGDTTKEYMTVPSQFINNTVNVSNFVGSSTGQAGRGGFGALSSIQSSGLSGPSSARVGGSVPVTIEVINDSTFNGLPSCGIAQDSITGGVVTFPKERFLRENKNGNMESDFMGVVDVVFSGHKVRSFTTSPGFGAVSASAVWTVSPKRDLVSMQHGKNWTWTLDASENVSVYMFSILEDDFAESICDLYSNPQQVQGSTPTFTQKYRFSNDLSTKFNADAEDFICNVGDALGYYNPGGEVCIVIERRRPSVDIFDPRGLAVQIAEQISITYTPIVIVDLPPPIAYASTTTLSSIDGTRTIAATGIIDQADGIVDADPTTTQDLEDSELSILQDNTNGFTLDVTIPFCIDSECLIIAQELLALQEEEVITKSIILGPDSQPRLGQVLPDGSIINEINYSYSDSSQYLITVTAGPKFLSAGSFNSSSYQLQTEDVTRDGIVIQDAGNGAEYVVKTDQFGEVTALSMVLDDISVGDKVTTRLHNVPQEHP